MDPVAYGETAGGNGGPHGGASRPPKGGAPTKWSNYSLINPPGAHVGPEEPAAESGKITGSRHFHLAGPRGQRAAEAAARVPSPEAAATNAVLAAPEGKTRRAAHADMMRLGPQGAYRYPPTSGMEVGWLWQKKAADAAAAAAEKEAAQA